MTYTFNQHHVEMMRDRRAKAALRRSGWRVYIVWESQLRDRSRVAARLRSFLADT